MLQAIRWRERQAYAVHRRQWRTTPSHRLPQASPPIRYRACLRVSPRPDPVRPTRAPVVRVAASRNLRLEPLARSAHLARRPDDPPRLGDGDALWATDSACDAEGHAAASSDSRIHADRVLPWASAARSQRSRESSGAFSISGRIGSAPSCRTACPLRNVPSFRWAGFTRGCTATRGQQGFQPSPCRSRQ